MRQTVQKLSPVSLHCVDRVIGTIYDVKTYKDGVLKKDPKHEGVPIEDLQKILQDGIPSKKIKYDEQGKPSQKIILKGVGTVTINPKTGELIQCNKSRTS